MVQGHGFAIGVLLVAVVAGCGSSGGDADEPSTDDGQGAATTPAAVEGDDTATDQTDDGSNGDDGSDDGSNGEQPATETTPGEVGTVVAGRAVATVSGTPDDREQQSGDVTHDAGQDCRGKNSLTGLEAGAAVTILDASSGEVVGTGQVESTSATEISDGSDGNPPRWDCYFDIRAALTSTPASIRVQVGDLGPWDVTGSASEFLVQIPPSDGVVPTDTTELFVDTTEPAAGTAPPTVAVTTPST